MSTENFIEPERIERMKRELDFPEFLRSESVEVKRSGKSHTFDCPCCGGIRKASAIQRDGVWVWKCWKCDEKGTAVDYVMRAQGVQWLDAVKILLRWFEGE
jgi:ribosomal protein L37AE/L43A